jgi:hypothetical protein
MSHRLHAVLIAAALAAGALFIASARADTITLGANHDNTLYQDPMGSLSNGAGDGVYAGKSGQNLVRRGLMSFSLTSGGPQGTGIPVGSTITAVTLTLRMSRTTAGATPVALHGTQAAWGEAGSVGSGSGATAAPGDATWTYRFSNTSSWSVAGGDFRESASAVTSVADVGVYTWSTEEMVGDVQEWLNNPATNFGWTIVGDETTLATAKKFDSRESATPGAAPSLVVVYTAPAPVCRADFSGDGHLAVQDIFDFLNAWFAGCP